MRINALLPFGLLFLFLLNGTAVTLLMLLAATLHEAGHITAAISLGAKIRRFDVELWGGKIIYGGNLSYRDEAVIALSGIALNLLTFATAFLLVGDSSLGLFFALANLAFAVLNLLPIKTLDGYVALNACLYAVTEQEKADSALKGLNSAFMLILCAAICCLVPLSGFNSSVLFLSFLTITLFLERN